MLELGVDVTACGTGELPARGETCIRAPLMLGSKTSARDAPPPDEPPGSRPAEPLADVLARLGAERATIGEHLAETSYALWRARHARGAPAASATSTTPWRAPLAKAMRTPGCSCRAVRP
jgi:hypothetical protein